MTKHFNFWQELSKYPYGIIEEKVLLCSIDGSSCLKWQITNDDTKQILKDHGLDKEDELIDLMSKELQRECGPFIDLEEPLTKF